MTKAIGAAASKTPKTGEPMSRHHQDAEPCGRERRGATLRHPRARQAAQAGQTEERDDADRQHFVVHEQPPEEGENQGVLDQQEVRPD